MISSIIDTFHGDYKTTYTGWWLSLPLWKIWVRNHQPAIRLVGASELAKVVNELHFKNWLMRWIYLYLYGLTDTCMVYKPTDKWGIPPCMRTMVLEDVTQHLRPKIIQSCKFLYSSTMVCIWEWNIKGKPMFASGPVSLDFPLSLQGGIP